MDHNFEILVSIVLSVLACMVLIPILQKIAAKVGLVDKPNFRKVHTKPVPLVGGIAILLSVIITVSVDKYVLNIVNEHFMIIITALVIFVMGVLDDMLDLNAKVKLLVQLGCAFMIAHSGLRLTSLYGFWDINEIPLWLQYTITIVLITGLSNSFNLMDGIDGLAGSLVVIGFGLFFVLNYITGNFSLAVICISIVGATFVFLKYNYSKKKIFMGDAGSLTFGYLLSTIALHLIHGMDLAGNATHKLVLGVVIAFFTIPTLDSLRVYKNRIKIGKSPFEADRTHLHHLFLSLGLDHKMIVFLIVMFVVFVLIMVVELSQFLTFTLIVWLAFSSFMVLAKILTLFKDLNYWKDKISQLESTE